jgi:hypothetical protein
MAITLSGDGISSDAIASLAASKLTGQVPDANAPSGSVIQVVTTYNASPSDIATTSTSLVASGITATITPESASNLILVEFIASMTDPQGTAMAAVMYVNGSAMSGSSSYHINYRESSVRYAPTSFSGTFQPSNTSAVTFQPFFRSTTGSSVRLIHDLSSYCLKLTEIKA